MIDLYEFFNKYFVEPTLAKSGYNLVNSITYGIILIVSLFLMQKVLKKLKIDLDDQLWKDLLPFVFLGGILRALEDIDFWSFLGIYHVLFITPMIYFLVFSIAFTSVVLSKYFWKKLTKYVGLTFLFLSLVIAVIKIINPIVILPILAVFVVSYLGFYSFQKFLKLDIIKSLSSSNSQVLASHLLDASAAFTSVSLIGGYFESSLGSSFVFTHFPPWLFILLKGAVILVILNMINKESKSDWNWLIKFTLLFLGLGPAVHNIFTLMMR